jgi:hypothetical protein
LDFEAHCFTIIARAFYIIPVTVVNSNFI